MQECGPIEHVGTTVPRIRRRMLRTIGLGLLVTVAVVAGIFLITSWLAEDRLQKKLAELDASDPGWRWDDIIAAREELPDDQNSAVRVQNVVQMFPGNMNEKKIQNIFEKRESGRFLTANQHEVFKTELEKARQALNEARKLKDQPKGHHTIAWSRVPIMTMFGQVQNAREVASILSYDVVLCCQEKDFDGALDSCRAILNCGRSLGSEPSFIIALVRFAIEAITINRIQATLALGEPSDAALLACQRLLEDEESLEIMYRAMRGERAMADRTLECVQSGEITRAQLVKGTLGKTGQTNIGGLTLEDIAATFLVGSVPRSRVASLELMTELLEASKLPEAERKAKTKEFEQKIRKMPFMAMQLAPAGMKVLDAEQRTKAQLRTTIAALAAERFRKAKKRWPETLEELVPEFLAKIPADPYDSKPLRYLKPADGIVIYSVGPNLVDDQGNLGTGVGRNEDIGCRLWNVAERGRPPLPEEPADVPQ